ncbi:MAG: hypothetical protein K5864_09770 [Bacteroidales bacterium]|nr:hypothetical protein [Bacteroidales bacterium]
MKRIAYIFIVLMAFGLFSGMASFNRTTDVNAPEMEESIGGAVKKAIAAGRNNKGVYHVTFRDRQYIDKNKFYKYMAKHDYYVIYGSESFNSDFIRFGEEQRSLVSADFIKKQDVDRYVVGINDATSYSTAQVVDLRDMRTAGSFQLKNVQWPQSQIKNGMVNGEGKGYVRDGNNYLIVSGYFEEGVPQGKCQYMVYNVKFYTGCIDVVHNKPTEFSVGRMNYGYATITTGNGKYGFLSKSGTLTVPMIYSTVVSGFNSQGFAVVKNNEGKEIKIDGTGKVLGYSDFQKAQDEAKRQAELAEKRRQEEAERQRQAEERRKEEEARQAEIKRAEESKYDDLRRYYNSFQNGSFMNAYDEYMQKYPNGSHRSEIESMKTQIKTRESRIAAGQDLRKWKMGNQVCVSTGGGILLGLVERFNEDRSSAQIKVVASPTSSYNGQTVKKDATIWIQKGTGWHLALDEEVSYASSNNSVGSINDTKVVYQSSSSSSSSSSQTRCSSCGGRGMVPCSSCNGTGRVSSGWGSDSEYETCSSCRGSGQYRCSSCSGKGYR